MIRYTYEGSEPEIAHIDKSKSSAPPKVGDVLCKGTRWTNRFDQGCSDEGECPHCDIVTPVDGKCPNCGRPCDPLSLAGEVTKVEWFADKTESQSTLEGIHGVLYPGGDMDRQWEVSELDEIAALVTQNGSFLVTLRPSKSKCTKPAEPSDGWKGMHEDGPFDNVYRCKVCGGENVDHACWVTMNTEEPNDFYPDFNSDGATFCADCEAHTELEFAKVPKRYGPKSAFCASLHWLIPIQWFDLVGVHDMGHNRIATISLGTLGCGDWYPGIRVEVIDKTRGSVVAHYFRFDDYLDLDARSDFRPDYPSRKGETYTVNAPKWEWYIAIPKTTRAICSAIEAWIVTFK